MRRRSRSIWSFFVLAIAYSLYAQTAEKPLSDALLNKLPADYQAKAKELITYSDDQQQALAKYSADTLFSVVVSRLMQKPDGAAFLLAELDKEQSASRRSMILSRFVGSAGQAYVTAQPEALDAIGKSASSDPDAETALVALKTLRSLRTAPLKALLEKRMSMAEDSKDQEGLSLLSDEHGRRYDWYGETTEPDFYRIPPAVFRVAPPEKKIRAVAFGDFGTGSVEQVATAKALREYAKTNPVDFGLTLGDNFYPVGMESPEDPRWQTQWEQLYGPMGIKFYATFGNHDYAQTDSPLAEILYSLKSTSWSMPAAYYSFTAGPVQFFAVDNVNLTERELQWLDEELAKSKAPWKVVFGHYQIYSATRGDNTEEQSNLVKRLLPVLKRQHADLYVNGHDHNLQILKEDGGVHFVVAGGGGASLYDFTQTNYTRNEFKRKVNGFAVIEADTGRLDVRLIDVNRNELTALNLQR